MLRLTEGLFRQDPIAKYADYYERTLYNHILSTQHPVHGGYVYFTPARPRHYRVYSATNQAMWCCVGSGMENHGKYNQLIYTHTGDSLFLNLFIASELNWKERGVTLKQQTQFPYEQQTKIIVTGGSSRFKLLVRDPFWVKAGALKILVNGNPISFTSQPSSYVAIDRQWRKGDVVQVLLPMHHRIERMPNVPEYIAFMYGPVLLAARTGTEDLKGVLADASRWGHIASGKRLPVDKAPIIIEDDIDALVTRLKPVAGKPLTFTARQMRLVNPVNILFEPFFKVHDSRYMMYWMILSNKEYRSYLDSLSVLESQRMELQKRTIDFVAPGEQQPEADHAMETQNSGTGNSLDQFWRDARGNGFFSYKLSTNRETGLVLIVRYWGAEWGNRKFDIYIDDQKLVTEDNTGRWNQSSFFDIEYAIPDEMIKGKESVRVKFQSARGSTAGAVYYVRLVRRKSNN